MNARSASANHALKASQITHTIDPNRTRKWPESDLLGPFSGRVGVAREGRSPRGLAGCVLPAFVTPYDDMRIPDPKPDPPFEKSSAMSQDLIATIYRQFSPAPLTADQTDLYVNLDDLRGNDSIVERLARRIAYADRPTHQVLAGHRGSGKSTELYRLQKQLQNGSPKYFVVFCRSDEDLDRNDIDFPDILIAMVRQLAVQLRERAGIELKPGYFKDRLERLIKVFTSPVEFQDVKLDVGMLKVGAAMKGSPDARLEIRKLLEPDTSNWLYAANEVIGEAILKLQQKGYAGLVVLVDDLDKMIVREQTAAKCTTAEYLFVHRSAQLTAFKCHVVYTMPLSLAYSHHEGTIKTLFGGQVPVVPMIKIATRPPEGEDFGPGLTKLKDIVAARLKAAGTTIDKVFQTPEILTELMKLSGGQPTELMTLVREALIGGTLPITHGSLQRAVREGQREYARQLRREQWPILEVVRQTGEAVRDDTNESRIRELLDSRAILQYVNDLEWYGLNPMVAGLKPPTPVSTSTAKPSSEAK